jgi:hypothetical protein
MDPHCIYGDYALVFLTDHGYAHLGDVFSTGLEMLFSKLLFPKLCDLIYKVFQPSDTSSDLTLQGESVIKLFST